MNELLELVSKFFLHTPDLKANPPPRTYTQTHAEIFSFQSSVNSDENRAHELRAERQQLRDKGDFAFKNYLVGDRRHR